jgi:hypothetical protein
MRKHPNCFTVGAAIALAAVFGGSAAAQQQASGVVDIELVLAADISQSLDVEEHQLQRLGYVEAFRNKDVIAAFTSGRRKRIAVTYMEWAGDFEPMQTIPWTIIDGEDSAYAFAAQLEGKKIYGEQRTSISRALTTAAELIGNNGITSSRQIVYLSGDGANNMGPPVEPVRDDLVKRGIVINGLPIMLGKPLEYYDIERMDVYFRNCVVGGEGAFVEPVRDLRQFSTLLASRLTGRAAGPLPPREATYDCMIGEKIYGAGPSASRPAVQIPPTTPP